MPQLSWSVKEIAAYPKAPDQIDTTFVVTWGLSAVGDTGMTAEFTGCSGLRLDPNAEYIEYANLTQPLVLEWLHAQLGADKVSTLEAEAIEKVTPTEPQPIVPPPPPPLPWS